MFEQFSRILPYPDDGSIMLRAFEFRKIAEIEGIPASHVKTIDVVGIVASVGEVETVTVRKSRLESAGEENKRRYITIVDDTMTSIDVSIWGDMALTEFTLGELLVIKGAKVSDFSQKTLKAATEHAELFKLRKELEPLKRVKEVNDFLDKLVKENPEFEASQLLNHANSLSSQRYQKHQESFLQEHPSELLD